MSVVIMVFCAFLAGMLTTTFAAMDLDLPVRLTRGEHIAARVTWAVCLMVVGVMSAFLLSP